MEESQNSQDLFREEYEFLEYIDEKLNTLKNPTEVKIEIKIEIDEAEIERTYDKLKQLDRKVIIAMFQYSTIITGCPYNFDEVDEKWIKRKINECEEKREKVQGMLDKYHIDK